MGRVLDPKDRELKIEKAKELLANGMAFSEIAKKIGISGPTIYQWRAKGYLGAEKPKEQPTKKTKKKKKIKVVEKEFPVTPAMMLTQSLVELMRQIVREELASMFSTLKE